MLRMIGNESERSIPPLLAGGAVGIVAAPLIGLATAVPEAGLLIGFAIGFGAEALRRDVSAASVMRTIAASLAIGVGLYVLPRFVVLLSGTSLLIVLGGLVTHWTNAWWYPGLSSDRRPELIVRLCVDVARRAGVVREAEPIVRSLVEKIEAPDRRNERMRQYRQLSGGDTQPEYSPEAVRSVTGRGERRYIVQVLLSIALSGETLRTEVVEYIATLADELGVPDAMKEAEARPSGKQDAQQDTQAADAKPTPSVPEAIKEAAAILGVEPSASREAIKDAYHAKARAAHPDTVQDDEATRKAEEQMTRINDAYRRLRDYHDAQE